ncbi:hypothetical protein D9M68_936290 [compost metagenome]
MASASSVKITAVAPLAMRWLRLSSPLCPTAGRWMTGCKPAMALAKPAQRSMVDSAPCEGPT